MSAKEEIFGVGGRGGGGRNKSRIETKNKVEL